MLRKLLRVAMPLAAMGLAYLSSGCDAAKDAAQAALGVSQIPKEDIDKARTDTNWDATVNATAEGGEPQWTLHDFAIKVEDGAPFEMGAPDTEIPLPFEVPAAGEGQAADKGRLLVLLKKNEFTVDTEKVTRFQIVTMARYENSTLKIDGGAVNAKLSPSQQLNKENQAGEYYLAEAKGTGGIAFLSGKAQVKQRDGTMAPANRALIYSSNSPFVTESGADGDAQYILAIPHGSKGQGFGFKAAHTDKIPRAASADIAYTGTLDEYAGEFDSKTSALGSDLQAKAGNLFDQANTAVTDFLDDWKLTALDITFVQGPADPPPAPPAPPAPPPGDTAPVDPPAEPEPAPPADPPVSRGDATVNVDLGCRGTYGENVESLTFDVAKDGHMGWYAKGDVRISQQFHQQIFGDPEALSSASDDPFKSRYPDQHQGYCLLTTGDQRYQEGGGSDDTLRPTADKSSEMWQKVKVPDEASGMKSIQVRVAFFSQEFPLFVGTQFNDSFFIKFDEDTNVIAEGNLNDLAAKNVSDVSTCKDNKEITAPVTCGEWKSMNGAAFTGALWNIEKSTQAPPVTPASGINFGCMGDATGTKCYGGWVPAAVICKPLKGDAYNWHGKDYTLRIAVNDAGDHYFDSAVAVDSIVFSNAGCGDGEPLLGGDGSRASLVGD